jgi:hypothetical protein
MMDVKLLHWLKYCGYKIAAMDVELWMKASVLPFSASLCHPAFNVHTCTDGAYLGNF